VIQSPRRCPAAA